MRRITSLLALVCMFVCGAAAQLRVPATATTSTSGTALQINNNAGVMVVSFEELWTGSPATVSVPIQGCMRGGTCDTLETNTSTSNSIRNPTISKIYDYFVITPSWTGGTNVTFTVNLTLTTAQSPSTGGGLADPGVNGIVFRTGFNLTRAAVSADVIALFSGSCSVSTYLRGDGSCGGSGVGTPACPGVAPFAYYPNGTTAAIAGNCNASVDVNGNALFNTVTASQFIGTGASPATITGTIQVATGGALSTSGSGTIAATTAVQLASTPTLCSGGQAPTGVNASGNAQGCFTPGGTYTAPSTVGGFGVWSDGGTDMIRSNSSSSTTPVLGTMYFHQLNLRYTQPVGHFTFYSANTSASAETMTVCVYDSTAATLLVSGSGSQPAASQAFSIAAGTQTNIGPGTFYVAFEPQGTTAGALGTYTSGAAGTTIAANKNGNRAGTAANTVSGTTCPASLGTLTPLTTQVTEGLLLLEP